MGESPRVGLIGAGSSGIAVLRELRDAGLDVRCFEASDRVGGNWVFGNRNGMSSSYATLHINTSRERMEYAAFPMPKSYPDFPRHDHIAAYFDAYVDRFALRDHIAFETPVQHAEVDADGGWTVRSRAGEERFDVLVVANGHHWDPRWPEPAFPGQDAFAGELMHSHDYKEPSQLAGRRVLVLGMGNSAMDIAVDASYHASRTVLAARRGAHIVPKYVFGKPVDQIGGSEKVPFAVRQKLFQGILRMAVGKAERYGLPEPDHRFGDAHPTISGRIHDRLAHGAIDVRPNIERFEGDEVVFVDGRREVFDLVVFCTGYRISWPFFDPSFLAAPDNEIGLFGKVFHPDHASLAFAGLLQPLGAIMPIAERQGVWLGKWLTGRYALPDAEAMRAAIRADREAMRKRYVASKRHTIQVDFDDYMAWLTKEMAAGEARAAARRTPVPA